MIRFNKLISYNLADVDNYFLATFVGPPTQHWTPQAEGITPPHCVPEEPSKVCLDI